MKFKVNLTLFVCKKKKKIKKINVTKKCHQYTLNTKQVIQSML